MSNKNRSARIALARIYGSGCMFRKSGAEKYIEKLGTIKTYKRFKEEKRYTSKKIKALETLLTYHHLVHKSNGGKPTIENGAIINSLAHQYIHSLPRNQEEIINNYLREYKQRIDNQEMPVEFVEDLEAPIVVLGTELQGTEPVQGFEVDFRNNTIKIKNLNREEIKSEQRKRKAQEKRELQKLKKEWEDR